MNSYGYDACSQSEHANQAQGAFDPGTKTSRLPHKTLALMAGLGWIGKHNLLVTASFGSALSLCTVLTNAPLEGTSHPLLPGLCGTCQRCQTLCPTHALTGQRWQKGSSRETLMDARRCTGCLECLAHCPWTQRYRACTHS